MLYKLQNNQNKYKIKNSTEYIMDYIKNSKNISSKTK